RCGAPVRAILTHPHRWRGILFVDRFKERGSKRIVEEVSRRGKNNLLTPILYHGLKKIKTVNNVIAEIKEGLLHRLPDQNLRGEVHDGLGPVLLEKEIKG